MRFEVPDIPQEKSDVIKAVRLHTPKQLKRDNGMISITDYICQGVQEV